MNDYKKMLDEKIEELNTAHDIDGLNNTFFSPFQGMTEMYALQKGYEAGFEKGANLLAPMLLEAIEKLEYVSLHLEDGYIVDEVLRKFEEFCK